ncbi:MAG: outer membrane lipoprotein carrier protein LolA, partial [Pseudomonas umsongensis]|nr:outer membrane lipoprotein carrier protein LolA [Pseudomonas umsongensis]
RIGKKLDTSPVLRGECEQSKTLKGFKKPLVSRGNFVMTRARGVQWLTTQPFASTLVITADRLVTQGEGGAGQKMDTRQEPGLRAFNETLMAVLMGDVKVLAARFKVEGTQDASGWRLSLVPRDATLLAPIARIDIEGDQVVRTIQLHEGSGDTNSIRFFGHKNSGLTTVEIGRFGA